MSFKQIKTKFWEFTDFLETRISVEFKAVPLERRIVNDADIDTIREFLQDIGEWESIIKGVRYLLSEIEIISAVSSAAEDHNFQDYIWDISVGSVHQWVDVRVRLSPDERHLRQGLKRSTKLNIEEIHRQLKNIPKWKALEKSVNLVVGSAE